MIITLNNQNNQNNQNDQANTINIFHQNQIIQIYQIEQLHKLKQVILLNKYKMKLGKLFVFCIGKNTLLKKVYNNLIKSK